MKVSRLQAAESRERILDAAAQLFRERGFHGVGVAEVMRRAGLTHGAFYGHFASKQDLMAQACARAFERMRGEWQRAAAVERPLAAIAASYLSPLHRDRPGSGCAAAALAADAAHQGPQVRRALGEGVARQVRTLEELMPGARREQALAAYAGLVGALVLARAVDDPALSLEFLSAQQSAATGLDQQGPAPEASTPPPPAMAD